MRTFFVSFVLLFFLFLGIFIGIQYAEEGIREVQGKDVSPSNPAVAADGEPVDLSLLGKTFENQGSAYGLGDTRDSATFEEERLSNNVYADIGAAIGAWVQQGVRGLTEWVLGWLDDRL